MGRVQHRAAPSTVRRIGGKSKATKPQQSGGRQPKKQAPAAPPPVWYPFGAGQAWGVPQVSNLNTKRKLKKGKARDTGEQVNEKWERFAAPAIEATELPQEFIDLASTAQLTAETLRTGDPGQYGDMQSFTGGSTAGNALGVAGVVTALPGMIGSGKDVFSGGSNLIAGYRGYDQGDGQGRAANSIFKNLGATQVESGVTGLITGGEGIGTGIAGMVAGDIPIAGAVTNFVNAGLSAKAATEDATASGKLGYQRRQARHDMDQQLPDTLRKQRFTEFLARYHVYAKAQGDSEAAAKTVGEKSTAMKAAKTRMQVEQKKMAKAAGTSKTPTPTQDYTDAKAEYDRLRGERDTASEARSTARTTKRKEWWKSKRNDFARFKKAVEAFLADKPGETDPSLPGADPSTFLAYLRDKRIKDFGYGTETRKQAEAQFKQARANAKGGPGDPQWQDYGDMRSLGKVSSFGQRRKAETATLSSVDAFGNVVEGVGSITAGADYGATKLAGKGVKGLKSLYTGTKTLAKRGRRVHKLRTAKNEMGYGDTEKGMHRERGVMWGARQFFLGDIDAQMANARMAVSSDGGEVEGVKSAKQMTPEAKQRLLRKLTKQCDRRINDLLRCLVTGNEQVYHRAKAILHVIAETNLAGAIQKIKDEDLDRYRALFWLAQNLDSTDHAKLLRPPLGDDVLGKHRAEFTRRSDALRTIISTQLQGVGG